MSFSLIFSLTSPYHIRDENLLNVELGEVEKNVHLIDFVKSFPTSILLRNLVSIKPRSSPLNLPEGN